MSNSNIFRINGLSESPYPNSLTLARGIYPDHSNVIKYGRITIPTTDTQYDLWSGAASGFTEYPWFTAASTLEIASSSALDTDGGTGVRSVLVFGLDEDYNQINELVTLNGQTPVATTKSFLRTFRMYGVDVGSLRTNAGNIWAQGSSGTWSSGVPASNTYKQAVITTGRGQTEMAIYTVPAGYTGYLSFAAGSISKAVNKSCDIEVWSSKYEETSLNNRGPWRNQVFLGLSATGSTFVNLSNSFAMQPAREKVDIKLTANADFTGSDVMGRFAITLVKEPQ